MMIAEFEARILAQIDSMVEHASEDDLFTSGYLRGHLTLAVAKAYQQQESDIAAVKLSLEESLQHAINAGELSPRDQLLVQEMWQQLCQSVTD